MRQFAILSVILCVAAVVRYFVAGEVVFSSSDELLRTVAAGLLFYGAVQIYLKTQGERLT